MGWADAAGMLRVGPQSAGALPGPACYGRGGDQPTITDAYVLLGLVEPAEFLGGKMPLQRELAEQAIGRLAQQVEMDPVTCAYGMITILDHSMTAALRVVSVERGHDPRDFALMAFGGAGALHLGALARELGIRRGLVPRYPSLFSAWGILAADLRHAYTQTVNRDAGDVSAAELNTITGQLRSQGEAQLIADGVAPEAMTFVVSMDMRYAGQEHNVNVAAPAHFDAAAREKLVQDFHAAHKQAYTYELPGEPVVITNLRLDAVGIQPTPQLQPWTVEGDAAAAYKGKRPVLLNPETGFVETAIYDRNRLGAGSQLEGPCIVEEESSTTVVHPGQRLTVDHFGNLVLEL
jgi:N-methylhydantoinase A